MPEPPAQVTPARKKRNLLLTFGWVATALLALTCLLSMFVGFNLTFNVRWGLIDIKLAQGVASFDWDKNHYFLNHHPDWDYKQFKKLGVLRKWGGNFDWHYDPFVDGLDGLKGSLSVACHLAAPAIILFLLTIYYRRQIRRLFPAGCCSKCGYDLSGGNHEKCPECGIVVTDKIVGDCRRRAWLARAKIAIGSLFILVASTGAVYLFARRPPPLPYVPTKSEVAQELIFLLGDQSVGWTGYTGQVQKTETSKILNFLVADANFLRRNKLFKSITEDGEFFIFSPTEVGAYIVVFVDSNGAMSRFDITESDVINGLKSLYSPSATSQSIPFDLSGLEFPNSPSTDPLPELDVKGYAPDQESDEIDSGAGTRG